jgi:purine-binding chemotaxis protein CheW
MRHVLFRIDKDRFGFRLDAIREIVEVPAAFTPVPRAPPILKGVTNVRGRVVPVIDLSVLLGAREMRLQADAKVILLEYERRLLGVLCDAIEGIDTVERIAPAAVGSSRLIYGMARKGALPLTILDAQGFDEAVCSAFQSR